MRFFFCNEYVAVLILRQKLFQNISRGKSAIISCSAVCDSPTAQQWCNPLFFLPLTWKTQMHDGKHDIGMIDTSHLNLLVPPEDLLLRNFGVNKWEKGKGCLLFIFIIKNTAAKERHETHTFKCWFPNEQKHASGEAGVSSRRLWFELGWFDLQTVRN